MEITGNSQAFYGNSPDKRRNFETWSCLLQRHSLVERGRHRAGEVTRFPALPVSLLLPRRERLGLASDVGRWTPNVISSAELEEDELQGVGRLLASEQPCLLPQPLL